MKRYPFVLVFLSLLSVFLFSSHDAWAAVHKEVNQQFSVKTDSLILQANTIALVSPSSCPSSGCAAGQRINFQAGFDVSVGSGNPNVQVCITSPNADWFESSSFSVTTPGWNTGDPSSNCSGILLGSANASLSSGLSNLNFSFRINAAANQAVSNPVSIEVFQLNGNWNSTASFTYTGSLGIAAAASPAYVANDAASCGGNSPCYINSGYDQTGGIGTGLKDAVDALPSGSVINILGNYFVKSYAVNINKPSTIQGINDASISTTDSYCTSNSLLLINEAITLQNLNIISPCNTRDLVAVSSPQAVTIQSNDLSGGNNAIYLNGNNGPVMVRFNQIQGNKGYGVLRSSGNGPVQIVANNIYGNRSGVQVDCAQNGQADHNFWGSGVSTSTAVANCSAANGKRLGAAIIPKNTGPGVDAQKVTVTGSKQSIASMGISVQQQGGNSFEVYIVNHGNGNDSNIPFLGSGTDFIMACGNFLDVFLADNSSNPNELDLYFKYDLNQACISTVESQNFCGQSSDPAKYPLWWFDPQNNVTSQWDTTGQNPSGGGANGATGQTTTCLTGSREIQVSITNNGRPGFQDLNFMPFVAGFYPVGFKSFTVQVNINQATIEWETLYETGISAFYIMRSLESTGTYSRIFKTENLGNETIGGSYRYIDQSLSFGKTYYYKLELIGTNGSTLGFYGPVTALTATATPTATQTSTRTITPTRTVTRTPTITRTPYVYRSSTPTRVRTKTNTPYRTSTFRPTNTPVPTSTMIGDATSTLVASSVPTSISTNNGYQYPETTEIAQVTSSTEGKDNYPVNTMEAAGSPTSVTTTTPPSASGQKTTFWVSLVTGAVLGVIVLGIAGWLLFQRRIFH